jgi:hypothetical protein
MPRLPVLLPVDIISNASGVQYIDRTLGSRIGKQEK